MSLFNEKLLREIVAEEVRRVLREELAELSRRGGRPEYLPVAEAAERAAVGAGGDPSLDGAGKAWPISRRAGAAGALD